MKQQINEIKRMQQLAGLITEAQLNENISFEAIDRMEELANIESLDNLKSSLKILVSDWIQDGGFDEDDVIDYLTHLVRNSYK